MKAYLHPNDPRKVILGFLLFLAVLFSVLILTRQDPDDLGGEADQAAIAPTDESAKTKAELEDTER
jgi:hypothetical protein